MRRPAPRPIGWPLLPMPDEHGQMAFPTLEQSVRQSIEIILRTRPGEQLMRPEFGAGLDLFLHQANDVDTRRRIRDAIAQGLGSWEPRILLDRVEVDEVAGKPAQVRVEIAYRLRRTGVPQKTGLTMELGG